MRQPLDHCVNSTERTLGLSDVYCFSRELIEPLSYKYPPSPLYFSCFLRPVDCKNPSLYVYCEILWVSMLTVRSFLKFCFKEVTSLYLACSYDVMLPKCCLVLLVVF
jgi:hypothetical protein